MHASNDSDGMSLFRSSLAWYRSFPILVLLLSGWSANCSGSVVSTTTGGTGAGSQAGGGGAALQGGGGMTSAQGGGMGECAADGDCDDGNVCTIDACTSGLCSYTPKNVDDGDACTMDLCDPASGIQHVPLSCKDDDPCTFDLCDSARGCVFSRSIFVEDFHDNSKGWSLDTGWGIGNAMMSSGQAPGYGTDPAEDHTLTSDNGIAGTYIGGNIPKVNSPYSYLTSPIVDLSVIEGPVYLEFARALNSDYQPYMDSCLEVYDGTQWVTVFNMANPPAMQENTGQGPFPDWHPVAYDVTAAGTGNASFQIRWGFAVLQENAVYSVGGWNIDDVRLVPGENCP